MNMSAVVNCHMHPDNYFIPESLIKKFFRIQIWQSSFKKKEEEEEKEKGPWARLAAPHYRKGKRQEPRQDYWQ